MAAMNTWIRSIQIIKPSITKASHLQTFKLSLLDKMCPDVHFNVSFFYSMSDDNNIHYHPMSQKLQDSLSKSLNLFYPMAGRYQDDSTIVCNDEGVVFMESETDYHLSQILNSNDHQIIEQEFLPSSYQEVREISIHGCPLLLVNFILFRCGGVGLSISVSHKIFDLASLMIFLNCWTATCKGSGEGVVGNLDIASSLLPPRELDNNPRKDPPSAVDNPFKKYAMRRLIFSPSKITELKKKLLPALSVENCYPSRVDVVLCLLWKSVMVSLKSVRGSFRQMVMAQAVNLRTRMDPLLSKDAIGNLAWPFSVSVDAEKESELNELLKKMMSFKQSLPAKSRRVQGEGFEESLKESQSLFSMSNKNNDLLLCSSWCNFQMFQVDFGMGNPVWVTSVSQFLAARFIQLLDTPEEGGMEALVFMEDEEMTALESNEELLQFAMFKKSGI